MALLVQEWFSFFWSAFWHRFIVPWGKSSTCSLFQFTYLYSRNKLVLRNEDYLAGLLKWWAVTDVSINTCCRDAYKLCCREVFQNSCHTMSSTNFRFYTAVHLQQRGSGKGAVCSLYCSTVQLLPVCVI